MPKTPNVELQEPYELRYDHVQVTADTTVKLDKIPAGKKVRIDDVQYVNPTGLAQDAANYFTIKLLKGSTVMASWSTQTGAQGTLTADAFAQLVLAAADADRVAAAGDELKLFLDEDGTATLPAGRIVVRGRYV